MPRPSVLLFVSGSAAVLLGLVWLWHSTRTEPAAPAAVAERSTPATPANAEPAAPSVPATAPRPAARVGRKPTSSAPSAPSMPAPSVPSGVPSLSDDAPPATRANTKNLHFGGTQLRAQAKAVEPAVRECIDKAAVAGARPSGDALLTYVVAKRGDKYLVEDTSFDDAKTTLAHEGLLECLHRTALGMTFVGLPREAEALVVTRSVTVENGALTEYKHVGFSYLR
jgi:hypothetical protein